MELFLQLPAAPSAKQAATALKSYIDSPKLVSSLKEAFISKLLSLLDVEGQICKDWDSCSLEIALLALKLVSRDTEGCEELYSKNGISLMMYYAGYRDLQLDTPASQEALKCLANMLLQRQDLVPRFAECGGVEKTVKKLHVPKLSIEMQFLLLRMTFLLTTEPTYVNTMINGLNVLAPMKEILDVLISCNSSSSSPTRLSVPYLLPIQLMTLNELLKTLYNLTFNYSKLSSQSSRTNELVQVDKEEDLNGFLAQTLKILHFPLASPPKSVLTPPHFHAISVLLNFTLTPSNSAFWFPETSDTRTEHQIGIVPRLLEMLDSEVKLRFDDCQNDSDSLHGKVPVGEETYGWTPLDECLPVLLILLTHISEQDKPSKDMIKRILMPKDLDRTIPIEKGRSLSHRMIQFMTTVEYPYVKNCTEELYFTLCDRDVSRFVRYFGFGSSAGFLVNNGLLGEHNISYLSNSCNTSENSNGQINPITGQINPITGQIESEESYSELKHMTDEEKEAEAERLFVLFEKLNRTGVIKVLDASTKKELGISTPAVTGSSPKRECGDKELGK